MVNKELVKYIQDYHAKGYTVETLRSFLVSQGYNADEVSKAISEAYTPKHHTKKLYLILVIVAVLVLVSSGVYLVLQFLQPETTLSLSLSSEKSTVDMSTPVTFVATFPGSQKSIPVRVSYSASRNGLEESSDEITSSDGRTSFTFTPKKPGTYVITTTIEYEEKFQSRSFSITVVPVCGDKVCSEDEVCSEDCVVNKCGDGICSLNEACPQDCKEEVCGNGFCASGENCPADCSEDSCGNDRCDLGEDFLSCAKDCPVSKCGNLQCEDLESSLSCPEDCKDTKGIASMSRFELSKYVPDKVKSVGAEATAKECNTITDLKDACFVYVMKASNKSLYCSLVKDDKERDDCYITYAFTTNDYIVCPKITDQYVRQTCDALAENYEFQKQYTQKV